jgi:hypothetical protein
MFETAFDHESEDQLGTFGKISLDKKPHATVPLNLKNDQGRALWKRIHNPVEPPKAVHFDYKYIHIFQFAAVPRGQFAAIPHGQFAAIPRGVRTSLPLALWLRGASPTTMLPAPSSRVDGVVGRSTDSARHPTPRLSASPSLGVDGMPRQAGNTPVHPSPLLLASPFTRVDGRLCREGGIQQQSFPLPADPTLSTAAL